MKNILPKKFFVNTFMTNKMSGPPKMYIIINSDLNMEKGCIAAQVSHITHIIIEELVRNGYEKFPPSQEYMTFMKWKKCSTTIVLKAGESQLKELLNMKNARAFYESGQTTQVAEGSLTVIGFFPSTEMSDIAKKFSLL